MNQEEVVGEYVEPETKLDKVNEKLTKFMDLGVTIFAILFCGTLFLGIFIILVKYLIHFIMG